MTMDYAKYLAGRANWIKGSALAEVMKKASELQKKGMKLVSLAAGDPDPDLIPRKVWRNSKRSSPKSTKICHVYSCKWNPGT